MVAAGRCCPWQVGGSLPSCVKLSAGPLDELGGGAAAPADHLRPLLDDARHVPRENRGRLRFTQAVAAHLRLTTARLDEDGDGHVSAYPGSEGHHAVAVQVAVCSYGKGAGVDQFADSADPIALLGDGLLFHKQKFQSQGTRILNEKYWSPQAAKVHTLGYQLAQKNKFADPQNLTPKYIRKPEAEEKWKKLTTKN